MYKQHVNKLFTFVFLPAKYFVSHTQSINKKTHFRLSF